MKWQSAQALAKGWRPAAPAREAASPELLGPALAQRQVWERVWAQERPGTQGSNHRLREPMALGDAEAPEPSVSPRVVGEGQELWEAMEAWARRACRGQLALRMRQGLQTQGEPQALQGHRNLAAQEVSGPEEPRARHLPEVPKVWERAAAQKTRPAFRYSEAAAARR